MNGNKNFDVMVLTCDKNKDIWPLFLTQLKKYWPEYDGEIFFNTESETMESKDYKLVFPEYKCQWDTPWSYRLKKCLEECKSDFVLLLLEDFLLGDYVDNEEFQKCLCIMENDKSIASFNFSTIQGKIVNYLPGGRFVEKERKAAFRMNLQAGLWRRSTLIKYIREHENPWQFEVWGSKRVKRYPEKIYHLDHGQKKVFYYICNGVIADGRWNGDECVEFVKNQGFDIDFSKRGIYRKGDSRKSEITHRTFLQKCWQVFKSLI